MRWAIRANGGAPEACAGQRQAVPAFTEAAEPRRVTAAKDADGGVVPIPDDRTEAAIPA